MIVSAETSPRSMACAAAKILKVEPNSYTPLHRAG